MKSVLQTGDLRVSDNKVSIIYFNPFSETFYTWGLYFYAFKKPKYALTAFIWPKYSLKTPYMPSWGSKMKLVLKQRLCQWSERKWRNTKSFWWLKFQKWKINFRVKFHENTRKMIFFPEVSKLFPKFGKIFEKFPKNSKKLILTEKIQKVSLRIDTCEIGIDSFNISTYE